MVAYVNVKGAWLSGGKSYVLHLPSNIPAQNFWTVTASGPGWPRRRESYSE
jgi:hypothetical protein